MYGHVTSSANSQLYTIKIKTLSLCRIKINKEFLVRLLKRGEQVIVNFLQIFSTKILKYFLKFSFFFSLSLSLCLDNFHKMKCDHKRRENPILTDCGFASFFLQFFARLFIAVVWCNLLSNELDECHVLMGEMVRSGRSEGTSNVITYLHPGICTF